MKSETGSEGFECKAQADDIELAQRGFLQRSNRPFRAVLAHFFIAEQMVSVMRRATV
jgi:hypothetical protein